MTTSLDLPGAARTIAAQELSQAFRAAPPFADNVASMVVDRESAFRLALLSDGIDLDDLDQAATVAATLHAIVHTDETVEVALIAAIAAATGAYEAGLRAAEVAP